MSAQNQTTQEQLKAVLDQYQQILASTGLKASGLSTEQQPEQLLTVDGLDGARAYKIGKNSKAALFDINEPVFYFKQTDANGNELPMKKYRFAEEDIPKADGDFVTVKDLNELREDIKKLIEGSRQEGA